MSTKMGRPKIANPKSVEVKARVTNETYQLLLDYAFRHKISIAATIRRGIELLHKDEQK